MYTCVYTSCVSTHVQSKTPWSIGTDFTTPQCFSATHEHTCIFINIEKAPAKPVSKRKYAWARLAFWYTL